MRMLIEVQESPEREIEDSYIIETMEDLNHFRKTESDALYGFALEEDITQLKSKALKLKFQMKKGLVGPGDEATIEVPVKTAWSTVKTAWSRGTAVRYYVSFLDDGGKHTGEPWKAQVAFGPLMHEGEFNPCNMVASA